jgi:hypothetical protein
VEGGSCGAPHRHTRAEWRLADRSCEGALVLGGAQDVGIRVSNCSPGFAGARTGEAGNPLLLSIKQDRLPLEEPRAARLTRFNAAICGCYPSAPAGTCR